MYKNYNTRPAKESSDEFIYGIRAIIEAIEADRPINKIIIQQGLQGDLTKELREVLKGTEISYQIVPGQKLNRVTNKNHQGAIAFVSPIEYQNIEDILPLIYEKGETPFLYILDRITDVRNMGAIARSAECNGVHAIIIPSRGSAMINADAVKTSTGALNKLPVCRSFNLKHTIQYLQESGVSVVGCTEKTEDLLPNTELLGPIAVIMGSEEDGISG
ncbi:MAG: 23S rRNA (guanosine2251-2'-O)-methyltransferase, partial [Flavobacteriales bacterium]